MRACARFRLVAPALAALAALLALAGPASAASEKVIREHYTDAFDDTVCGLAVHVEIEGTFRATIHEWVIGPADPPADEFWIGNINDHGAQTWTNTDNGKSVVRTYTVNIKEASLVDVGGGNYEYTYAVNGPVIKFGGKPVDVGHIVVTDTIHLGDLSTGDDDFFVDSVALFDAGRHPGYYSEEPFCDALIAAIG
jgi:hypothetical protein